VLIKQKSEDEDIYKSKIRIKIDGGDSFKLQNRSYTIERNFQKYRCFGKIFESDHNTSEGQGPDKHL